MCPLCKQREAKQKGLCKICYDREWRAEQRVKLGLKPPKQYGVNDPEDMWRWIRDELKIVQAQPKQK